VSKYNDGSILYSTRRAPRIAAGPAMVHLTLKGRMGKKGKKRKRTVYCSYPVALFIRSVLLQRVGLFARPVTITTGVVLFSRPILLQPGGTIHRGPITVLQSGGTVHGSVTFIRGTICVGSQSITLTRRPPRVAAGHCLYRVVQSQNPLLLKRAEQFTKPITVTTRLCYSRRTVTVTTGWDYS
jgi:hypothetical protein